MESYQFLLFLPSRHQPRHFAQAKSTAGDQPRGVSDWCRCQGAPQGQCSSFIFVSMSCSLPCLMYQLTTLSLYYCTSVAVDWGRTKTNQIAPVGICVHGFWMFWGPKDKAPVHLFLPYSTWSIASRQYL